MNRPVCVLPIASSSSSSPDSGLCDYRPSERSRRVFDFLVTVGRFGFSDE